jgi:hypothetical protein
MLRLPKRKLSHSGKEKSSLGHASPSEIARRIYGKSRSRAPTKAARESPDTALKSENTMPGLMYTTAPNAAPVETPAYQEKQADS